MAKNLTFMTKILLKLHQRWEQAMTKLESLILPDIGEATRLCWAHPATSAWNFYLCITDVITTKCSDSNRERYLS